MADETQDLELVLMNNVIQRAREIVDRPTNPECKRILEWALRDLDNHRQGMTKRATA